MHLLAAALYRRNRSKKPEAVARQGGREAGVSSETTIPAADRDTLPPPPSPPPLYHPIIALYITAPNPFPALETFVASSAEYYALDLRRYGGGGMKRALAEFQESERGKGVRAFFVGTRRGDPHGGTCSRIAKHKGEGEDANDLLCGIGQQVCKLARRRIRGGRRSCVFIRFSTGHIKTSGRSCVI